MRPYLAVALVVLLAACVTPPAEPDAPSDPEASHLTLSTIANVPDCSSVCYEPTVAADSGGRLFVTEVSGTAIHVSDDGGQTFTAIDPPPHPAPLTDNSRGDSLLYVDAEDRLWFVALAGEFHGGMLRYRGVQVASSVDHGATWKTNVLVSRLNEPTGPTTFADRPWIAVGAEGTVYVTFFDAAYMGSPVSLYPGTYTLHLARSDDGGRTFSAFTEIDGIADEFHGAIGGPPVVDSTGRLAVPYLTFPSMASRDSESAMRVAMSADGGETFEHQDLLRRSGSPGAGSRFPALGLGTDDTLVAAWNGLGGTLLVSTSKDHGATWSEPAVWTDANTTVTASPWVAGLADGTIAVAWFAMGTQPGTADVRLTYETETIRRTLVLANGTQGLPTFGANTDLAHFAVMPDGGVAVVWSDQATGDASIGLVR